MLASGQNTGVKQTLYNNDYGGFDRFVLLHLMKMNLSLWQMLYLVEMCTHLLKGKTGEISCQ